MNRLVIAAALLVVAAPAIAADVSQDAIDACIEQIRAVGGPDGQSGTVISTEFSQANSLVMFRDRGNTVWRCLVSNDGSSADVSIANAADDGEGAMAGAPAQAGAMMRVTGVASDDVLNVRSGPSTRYNIVGALSNGTRVRSLGCRNEGGSRWCNIRMLDDMRSEGWVNASFLKRAAAGHKPKATEPGGTGTSRVRFAPGSVGAELSGELAPGASHRYLIDARDGQDLRVHLTGKGLSYQIFNPDRSFLLDQVPASQAYRGQLLQSGDHVVEVINRGNRGRSFRVSISVQ